MHDDATGRPHPSARSRPRRRRLLAAAIAGAVTLGVAAPAGALLLESALDSGAWWQAPPGVEDDTVSTAPVEPAPAEPAPAPPAPPQDERAQQAERQMQEAIDDVRALLADPRCAAYIGGTPDEPGHPLDVFNAMVAADNPRAIYNTWSEDHGTSWAIGGRLDDEGGRPVIQVFRRFHEVEVPAWTYNRVSG